MQQVTETSHPDRGGPKLGGVLLGAAVVGSLLVLASMGERTRRRCAGGALRRHDALRAQQRNTPESNEDEIPVLRDVVPKEDLERWPGEPPVLTDVVVPGRGED